MTKCKCYKTKHKYYLCFSREYVCAIFFTREKKVPYLTKSKIGKEF